MRILITGAAGMLGTDLCAAATEAGHTPLPTDVRGCEHQMDITDAAGVLATMRNLQPDVVIHCAAFTNVDGAERDPEGAYRLNALGSWCVASACAELDIPICAISTDFVFDGTKTEAYTEFDRPNPLSVYGASKLAGEERIRTACRRHWIARTAWLYGVHGKSFPDSILRAAETRSRLSVVADQCGAPTYTGDLARALLWLVQCPLYGTYHVTNSGSTSWFGLATAALELDGRSDVDVVPIPSSEWPSPTRRPANSVLRCLAWEALGAPPMRPWREALADFVRLRKERAGR